MCGGLLPYRWLRQRWFDPKQPALRPGVHADLLRLFNKMLAAARPNPPYANQLLVGLTIQLVAAILSRLQRAAAPADDLNAKLIAHTQKTIVEKWNQPLDMETLPASLRRRYRHFRRLFQHRTDPPRNQFLFNLRVNRAKRLLEENLTIEQVAERVGFADP